MFLVSLAALAQTAATPPAQQPETKPPEEKVICHIENIGASRIGQRVCRTKAEWAKLERDTEQQVQDNFNKMNNPGNTPE
ncbi:MAG: hypothetical protein ACJ8FT_06585 [Sphingomonas sp.]